MSVKTGLGALAFVTAAAIAGAGWALQTPDGDAPISSSRVTVHASSPEETTDLSMSVLSWPRPVHESDDPALDGSADKAQIIDGLEAMSATGTASSRD